jgi:hypothetical protein
MISELNGEIRNVRSKATVVWCGFCDRSRQVLDTWDLESGVGCDGCDALFKDVEVVTEVIVETPRRRRRATVTQLEADEESASDES